MKSLIMVLFKIGLVLFLALGVAVVLVQAAGLVAGSPGLVSGAVSALGLAMTVSAGVTGLLGFVMSYLFHWKTGED
ncbi:unnamed protein product [[Actinomadura] parvosata subsp. kistnae]|uniref:Uncharacterized protein n=2 Tax=Nonomuraea TaxID=83681 RepID=A0A1U9ZTE9_9ACTN|nr:MULTISPECIES: hypothetical protein [unclassified Nonomuraea]AQZ61218.1 hypothetical protein BKM31_06720 [Nonomuraea sp. ATCC 55076]NJP97924.1 hypothetical protein [Nonomuraea sp. FMUSA5-5]SPL97853.1 unnamed protein product [Actinomadura parvosata subsp. kistnae]